ncbi:MAG TPA: LysR family transcriptional regulator [Gemmataceae bacterium]|nr:LysR family transcriptional regulator [Gemmataceae bacterium]
MPLPYDALRIFLAVARAGSFSRAARQLGVSQPWVSQRVAQLEDYLGRKCGASVILLERHRGGVVLTPDGRLLCDLAAGPLGALEQLEDAFESSRGPLSGRVRLAAASTVLLHLLPEALLRFRRSYPQVRVETCPTTTPAMVAQVLEDQVDFAVGDPGDTVPANVRVEVIRSCDRVLVVPKGDPLLRLPVPLHAHQLRHRDWIVLPSHSLSHRKLDALLGHYSIAMEVEHWEVMKTYIALGVGIGIMPDICLVPTDYRRLRTIPLGSEFGRNHFAIVLRKKKVLSPAALALIDVIRPGLAKRLAK